ncbi:hypothetical protein [Suttonella ornithocola]|uniref:Lipoprotein n=1 Tax=Suttonella ornithocola TaxID=279832 RepID=A0A380MRN7_9GAMM|nr:hypothetical protein [Suttonella ornithocola]SUO94824.1 Uncharacterised protein [Suttonella ornithocola]
MKTALMLIATFCLISACSDDKPKESPKNDNPLIKMQQETTQKAQDAVNSALEKQTEALENIDK